MGRVRHLAWLIILLATPAYGMSVKLYYMPEGTDITLATGEKVRYFTLPQYLQLIEMDNKLHTAEIKLMDFADLELKLEGEIGMLKVKNSSLAMERDMYSTRSERLEAQWYKCEQDLVKKNGVDGRSLVIGLASGFGAGVVATLVVVLAIVFGK